MLVGMSPKPGILVTGVAPFVGAFAYTNTDGQGDRTGTITVDGFTPSAGTANRLVDGVNNVIDATGSCRFTNGASSQIIRFVFGGLREIDQITWKQGSSTGHGNWVAEGSLDNSNWVQQKSSFALGGSSSDIVTTMDSTMQLLYFRLRQISGTVSSTPWLQEIKFRIRNS